MENSFSDKQLVEIKLIENRKIILGIIITRISNIWNRHNLKKYYIEQTLSGIDIIWNKHLMEYYSLKRLME